MATRESRFWLGLVSVLVCLLVSPVGVESQCATSITMMTTSPASPPTYPYVLIRIDKMLNMGVNCGGAPTMAMADACAELTMAGLTTRLRASAYTNTATPYCNWVCNCGAPPYDMQLIRTDGGNGLPVELMDFGIEVLGAEGSAGLRDENPEAREDH